MILYLLQHGANMADAIACLSVSNSLPYLKRPYPYYRPKGSHRMRSTASDEFDLYDTKGNLKQRYTNTQHVTSNESHQTI